MEPMKNPLSKLKEILIVPLVLAAVLVPFSLFIGWNLFTLVLFWFLMVPSISFFAPRLVSPKKNLLLSSMLGLVIFYVGMVFMIYKQAQSDFFQVLIWSALINLALTGILHFAVKQEKMRVTNG